MKPQSFKNQDGFSFLELLVVIVVIGIVTTFAIMQVGKARVDFQRQRIAREFKNYLERARFDSVKRRAEPADASKVVITGPASFTATLDFDGDGRLTPAETRTINFGDRAESMIRVSGTLNYPITLAFSRRGLITSVDGGGNPVTPLFTICSDCSSGSTDITRISISPSGTVAELRRGQDPETLPSPANTNQAMPSTNCYVLATNSSSPCIRN